MIIPKSWACIHHEAKLPDGSVWPMRTWGWGENAEDAKSHAEARAEKVRQRLLRRDIPEEYEYGDRPLREEIIETVHSGDDAEDALITRNRYGALILNSASLLFLDIDQKIQKRGFLARLLGRASEPWWKEQLGEIKEQLAKFPHISFRIYQTAAGFRVIATSKPFAPSSDEARELMQATSTDQLYTCLCLAQQSFRARLTPKPWRCGQPLPPNTFPRSTQLAEEAFIAWRRNYEQAIQPYATCTYLETIGGKAMDSRLSNCIAVHDSITRCTSNLPLA